MNCTVHDLARLSGVSPRTLRYYDHFGLLKPEKTGENGYRYYGQKQIDLLQQILFYRELGLSLEKIKKIVASPDFDRENALNEHLFALIERRKQVDRLIATVEETLVSLKGEKVMSNEQKFEAFKESVIKENEKKYGAEVRQRYGDESFNASNAKLRAMDESAWNDKDETEKKIAALLKTAAETGDPAGVEAQQLCDLHRQWICMFWKDGTYSKPAHLCLAETYLSDERFKQYYDEIVPGGAQFLHDALVVYCK